MTRMSRESKAPVMPHSTLAASTVDRLLPTVATPSLVRMLSARAESAAGTPVRSIADAPWSCMTDAKEGFGGAASGSRSSRGTQAEPANPATSSTDASTGSTPSAIMRTSLPGTAASARNWMPPMMPASPWRGVDCPGIVPGSRDNSASPRCSFIHSTPLRAGAPPSHGTTLILGPSEDAWTAEWYGTRHSDSPSRSLMAAPGNVFFIVSTSPNQPWMMSGSRSRDSLMATASRAASSAALSMVARTSRRVDAMPKKICSAKSNHSGAGWPTTERNDSSRQL